jgi:hypothetical protein
MTGIRMVNVGSVMGWCASGGERFDHSDALDPRDFVLVPLGVPTLRAPPAYGR